MDIKDIKTLIKMVTDTDISEFEMENAEERIVIKRGSEQEIVHVAAPPAVQAPVAAPVAAAPAAAPAEAPADAKPAVSGNQQTINSPIVGTFYRKPSPDADPFADVGDTIEKGGVVCLVEAMKMFNEIEADFKCKIVEILKEDAEPVEFGDPLFIVEPL